MQETPPQPLPSLGPVRESEGDILEAEGAAANRRFPGGPAGEEDSGRRGASRSHPVVRNRTAKPTGETPWQHLPNALQSRSWGINFRHTTSKAGQPLGGDPGREEGRRRARSALESRR